MIEVVARRRSLDTKDLEGRFAVGTTAVNSTVAQWRRDHPQATLREIEVAIDEQLGALRAQMLMDVAMVSAATTFADRPVAERPRCRECDTPLESRGVTERSLLTTHGQEIRLRSSYGICLGCGLALFPPR